MESPTPVPDPIVIPEPGTPLDFAVVSKVIFAPHCVKCHNSFTSYAKVIGRLDEIQLSIDMDKMPKTAPGLPPELKRLLSQWVNAGAPETLVIP